MRRTTEEHIAVILGQTIYPRFLDEERIEDMSKDLLDRCGIACSIDSIPVPVESILEAHLRFHLEFDELGEDILAATCLAKRTVTVNERLDPSEHPTQLGRFRFTIAHEIGHIWLHTCCTKGLAPEPDEPSWRTHAGENFLDYQANRFAGYLLIPSAAIRKAWWTDFALIQPQSEASTRAVVSKLIRSMARTFEVSRAAMEIRLEFLGLIESSFDGCAYENDAELGGMRASVVRVPSTAIYQPEEVRYWKERIQALAIQKVL